MPVIPAVWKLRQEYHEFKADLGYIVRLCFKKNSGRTIEGTERRGEYDQST
jgi:hypothetical protein